MLTVAPTSSKVRSVFVYSSSAPAGSRLDLRNISNSDLIWPNKHPQDTSWYWLDLTEVCQDLSDTVFQVGASVVYGDSSLSVLSNYVSVDGLKVGFQLSGGNPGVSYAIRGHITFSQGEQISWDVLLRVSGKAPVPTPNPGYLTNNQDIVLLGGIPFPSG